jgi:hypothetical protein
MSERVDATQALIRRLSAETAEAGRAQAFALPVAMALASLLAFGLVVAVLGVRADLVPALAGVGGQKILAGAIAALGAAAYCREAARPDARTWPIALLIPGLLAFIAPALLSDAPLPAWPSVLADPAFTRRNTRDNTPCVLHVDMVKGNKVSVDVAAKGGGSENKSKFKMMNPSDSIVDWVLEMLPQMGAGWCPPGMLGIGIGGTAEHCMLLAKQALMEPIDMAQLKLRGPQNDIEALRIEIFDKVNALGIGAQGLGGLSTILDVKIMDAPCHAAGKPVAMIPNCAATRHAHFTLDGRGAVTLPVPIVSVWPAVVTSNRPPPAPSENPRV